MTTFKNEVLAKRYARAFFEVAAEAKIVDLAQADLGRLSQALTEEPLLGKALASPGLSPLKRLKLAKLVATTLSFSEPTVKFIQLLVEKRRSHLFQLIWDSFQKIAEERAGLVRAQLQLSQTVEAPAFSKSIQDILEKILKRPVQCETEINPALLGGFVIAVGDVLYDSSVAGKLKRLREGILIS